MKKIKAAVPGFIFIPFIGILTLLVLSCMMIIKTVFFTCVYVPLSILFLLLVPTQVSAPLWCLLLGIFIGIFIGKRSAKKEAYNQYHYR